MTQTHKGEAMTLSFPLEYAAVKKAVRELKFRTRAFIDGEFRDAASGESYVSINPATGKPLAEIAACGTPEVDAAVKAARRAFEKGTWARRRDYRCRPGGAVHQKEARQEEPALYELLCKVWGRVPPT
jgi:hypothetical protein